MSNRDTRAVLFSKRGFTFAEALIAAALSSFILIGLYLMYETNQVTFVKGERQTDLQQNARIALDRIVRELRVAGSDPSGVIPVGGAAILVAEAGRVQFYADADSDSATERVEYSFDAAAQMIRRQLWTVPAGTTAGAQQLAQAVTVLTFAYYDGANILLPSPVPAGSLGSIRRVSVSVTTADTVTGQLRQPFIVQADVRPRNLGL
jgi:Tfp pilus assembly protein PilW